MGHYFGMRLSRVLARETSMMPNNGTGQVLALIVKIFASLQKENHTTQT